MNEDIFHLGVKALIRNKEGKILLLYTDPARVKSKNKQGFWDLPGGRMHRKDNVLETLHREVKEETGISFLIGCMQFAMFLMPVRIQLKKGDAGLILWVYHCSVIEPYAITLSLEHTSYDWIDPREACARLGERYPSEFLEKLKIESARIL